MKKIALALAAALLVAGFASAQVVQVTPTQPQVQTLKVTGKLELINGVIGMKVDGKTYLVPRLRSVVGFIKDLQEGATVTVEGNTATLPNSNGVNVIIATKLSFNGKDYDLGQPGQGMGMARGMMKGGRGMMGGGRW
jgi:hypothetical protein